MDLAPRTATAFAPASVGNVAVGFDILGHAIEGVGDRVTATCIDERVVRIASITGVVTQLPFETERNTAARAVQTWYETLNLNFGIELHIHKGISLGSGMGGSAASATAALIAANALLTKPVPADDLYPFACEGEAVASGGLHGDNVAPQLLGGLVLATAHYRVRIPVPQDLTCVLVHPDWVVETRHAREVLRGSYELKTFVQQSTNLALVLAGCWQGRLDLIRAGFADVLIEPRRAALVPGFSAVKQAALDHNALGASISGAGPSVFAWFESKHEASTAVDDMRAAFALASLNSQAYVSSVNAPAAHIENWS